MAVEVAGFLLCDPGGVAVPVTHENPISDSVEMDVVRSNRRAASRSTRRESVCSKLGCARFL